MSTTLPVQRSTFVTVLAWIFIVLSGFSTLIALMQNAMLWFVFEGAPGVGDAMSKANQAPGIPPFFGYFFRYFPVIFAAFLLLSATTLASSIGLLLARARRDAGLSPPDHAARPPHPPASEPSGCATDR